MRNLKVQVEKAFCYQNCPDLLLFEWIVLVIPNILQILAVNLEFQKFFSITRTIFSHSESDQFG